ncbi:substrate-binding periplasmic protein [Pseudomonas akapageensis]|uniref:substrate-binding periplasmic protein n=1 Tax=Pseudomonas akapageensis TaxID=2609961 RepID=UPI00140875DA|nr:transporter substrate-binding domain-containing protein [Pseudomonas akapageensis]
MLQSLRVLGLLGMLLMAGTASADRLRLVADAWPPFTDATMVNGGLATDIVSTALARAGFASEFEQVPWARAMLGLGEGRYDVLVSAWYSEERTRLGQFSSGYLVNRIRLLKRKDDAVDYNALADLYSLPVAVVRGYAYSPPFDNDEKVLKVPVHSFSMAAKMLAAGRVKLTLEDEYVARYYLARETPRLRNRLEFLPKPLSENSLHILVSLKHPEHQRIVAGFDKAIAEMKADGTYERLLQQHGM